MRTHQRPKHPFGRLGAAGCVVLAAALAVLALAPAPALAVGGPPIVSETTFSAVTATSATLHATLDPNLKETAYHFEYITEEAWVAEGEEFGEGAQSTPQGEIATGFEETHAVAAAIANLQPATAYRFRLFASNIKAPEGVSGEEVSFATYPAAPAFSPCPNEELRSGGPSVLLPPTRPSALLPDCRAYEQASPVDKDGGDAVQIFPLLRASTSGRSATFGTTAGIPGGVGAQEIPLFRAERTEAGWSVTGLEPPAAETARAVIKGWLPDLSLFFLEATRFDPVRASALIATGAAGPPLQLTPFVPGSPGFAYAGAGVGGQVVLFESSARLPAEEGEGPLPGSLEGKPNLYAWDRESGKLSLADQMNSLAESEEDLSRGAFTGPYNWMQEKISEGGSAAGYYTQDEQAVSEDGSVLFTAAGTGRLYERLNPTEEQSAVNGAGECTEPAKACTIDPSAGRRTPPDPAGQAPRAFQAAATDGRTAFFTSSEKLTDDANTGPEAPAPVIGRATLSGPEEEASSELGEFLKGHHAVGIAVSGEHIYWADPNGDAIGRARLEGAEVKEIEDPFIEASETCFETRPGSEPGKKQCAPSAPRYVAVQGDHVYWTSPGPLGGEIDTGSGYKQLEELVAGAGTIGRAELDGSEALVPDSVDPDFITGASNPQGIAVNSEHVYWANSLKPPVLAADCAIARAGIDGEAVEQHFFQDGNTCFFKPGGVALSATRVYWTIEGTTSGPPFPASVQSLPLEGGTENPEILVVGEGPSGLASGLAVIGPHLYWTDRATGTIGRVRLPLEEPSDPEQRCHLITRCEAEFLKPGGSLSGLAGDPSKEHLFWSANGEIPPHPGNDLYRFQAAGTGGCSQAEGCMTDLTPLPGGNGAEVKGALGASKDGTRLYFAANGVLANNVVENGAGPEEAQPGDCAGRIDKTPRGECNLYLWEGDSTAKGEISFIARLEAEADGESSDAFDWAAGAGSILGNSGGAVGKQKQSRVSPSGGALLFRSRRDLTGYDSRGLPEYYLYRAGHGVDCLSCDPTGAPGGSLSGLGSLTSGALRPALPASLASRNLADEGRRAFFETTGALVAADLDGASGCPTVGEGVTATPSCLDVYEWEAPGAGSCEEGAPPYSPANGGCLYLLSDGSEAAPSFFADASESGDDAFILTRSRLVGQDGDQLLDLYDVRAGGGLASQSPLSPEPCQGPEACRPSVTPPPALAQPSTPSFQGEGNVKSKPPKPCPKGTRKVRRNGKTRCVKIHRPHHRHHQNHKRPDRRPR